MQYYPSPGVIQNVSENFSSMKVVIIMVGLPVRGKSFIAHKLDRFLSWLGFKTEVFDVQKKIRESAPNEFDRLDNEGKEQKKFRKQCAFSVLNELTDYLKLKDGNVGIYDGHNVTRKRRESIQVELEKNLRECEFQIIWIESVFNEEGLVKNCVEEHKRNSSNFIFGKVDLSMVNEIIQNDMKYYSDNYEPFDIENASYIQIVDFKNFICKNIAGYIQAKILYYLVNLKIKKKAIFLTRHGESEYNVLDKVGGDSPLSENGRRYANAIYGFMEKQPEFTNDLKIFCSTLKRSIETVQLSNFKRLANPPVKWRALAEIESGICDGMTYKEIEEQMNDEFVKRDQDKLNYRYPKGESYKDLIMRLEPIILELERATTPVLVVGHRAVLRCLYGYFTGVVERDIPHLDIPLHTIIKLEPRAFDCGETRFKFDINSNEIEKS